MAKHVLEQMQLYLVSAQLKSHLLLSREFDLQKANKNKNEYQKH